jgi:DNA-binding IscR family transcriptional regulator
MASAASLLGLIPLLGAMPSSGNRQLPDIVDAAQGRDALFKCREICRRCAVWPDDEPPRGALSGVCAIHAVVLKAEHAIRSELAARTLADVGAAVGSKSPCFVRQDVPG